MWTQQDTHRTPPQRKPTKSGKHSVSVLLCHYGCFVLSLVLEGYGRCDLQTFPFLFFFLVSTWKWSFLSQANWHTKRTHLCKEKKLYHVNIYTSEQHTKTNVKTQPPAKKSQIKGQAGGGLHTTHFKTKSDKHRNKRNLAFRIPLCFSCLFIVLPKPFLRNFLIPCFVLTTTSLMFSVFAKTLCLVQVRGCNTETMFSITCVDPNCEQQCHFSSWILGLKRRYAQNPIKPGFLARSKVKNGRLVHFCIF